MQYRIIKVSTGSELNDFMSLPFTVYRNDRNWIPPITAELSRMLDTKKNPYFRNASLELFNCYSNEKMAARVAVSVNEDQCRSAGIRTGFFGFFESLNDENAVAKLFETVFDHCRRSGIRRLEGPVNHNMYSELGMLCSHYDQPPTFFQTYNPEYYNALLTDCGFENLIRLHTRINKDASSYMNEKYGKIAEQPEGDLKIRSFRGDAKAEDLEHLRSIFNSAFSGNWHFTPVSRDEYLFASKFLKLVTPPELIKFVEYKGEPAGAVHFALDINPLLRKFRGRRNPLAYLNLLLHRRRISRALIFAVGIKKEFQSSRITRALFNATVDISRRFRIVETTWMYDDNRSAILIAERLGLRREKEFQIYFKDLTG